MTLPEFPSLDWGDVNEWRVERAVERLTDRADVIFMDGQCTQDEYDSWHRALNDWANNQWEKTRYGRPV